MTSQFAPWQEGGLFLEERPAFKSELLFQGGAYYVQESSSMFAAEAARQLLAREHITNFQNILDLCAAPGGKSFLMVSVLPSES